MAEGGSAGGWSTIESDEGVFTSLIEQLGVKGVQFEELVSLDADSIRALSPVYGVIFLFKWIGSSSENQDAPLDGSYDTVAADKEGLFFAAQIIQNACGTQAILSVILNNDKSTNASSPGADATRTGIEIGPALQEFKDFTTGFPAGLIGDSLSNSDLIRETHNSFARSSPFADETQRDASAGTEDVFHFIAYTCHHGELYELDGLQPYPITHGKCTPDEFPEKIIPVLHRRIERYPPGEVRFNLMVVCQDLRIKAQEFQDYEGLARERRKRAQWDWENALRRHNFVGFTGEVLKGVVGLKLKDGSYDAWVEDAKKETKKRLRERAAKGQEATATA
ncbi:ubiquitin carboxyl-terminal hydrolase L5 [Capronia epimyces CBS 606.96]|uniref:Ubiquitin carboxyl-terminal hydrolase n=1 Tax=Capronia epimyces CBS 606.96 TaxID=1182542 RepID=W9YGM7_9EURO|nr:ubiquitin carboxyl-terminal hydrolase L5 [Capronia epimyces CBS 606.96]EXJ92047.1 ubiquitin carboxyl-terminal hydrolase L5 [Capronia epimyces CBS 606.96]